MATAAQARRERSARAIAELLEQLSRVSVSRAIARGMNPVHWSALRYFAQANESARHVGAFAAFNMTTASSASQTITALVKKKLLAKKRGIDSRQRLIELTPQGRRLLEDDPINVLAASIASLSDDQLLLMAEVMERLAVTSYGANPSRTRSTAKN